MRKAQQLLRAVWRTAPQWGLIVLAAVAPILLEIRPFAWLVVTYFALLAVGCIAWAVWAAFRPQRRNRHSGDSHGAA